MEARHTCCDLVHVGAGELAACQHPLEQAALIELAHAQRVLDRLTLTLHRGMRRRTGDRDHVLIQLGREPPVQPQLLAAEEVPLGKGREVEEAERERLLELVRMPTGQQNVGDVRLDVFDVGDRMRITARVQQRVDQLGVRVDRRPRGG
jgi:hypothetical protein